MRGAQKESRVKILLALIPLACAPYLASAQNDTASPDEVARQFFKAEQDGRWLDAARLLDLSLFEPLLRAYTTRPAPEQGFGLTPELLQKTDPQMPRAVAEYEVKKARDSYSNFDPVKFEFARVSSRDSLAALPVDEAAARWLEAKDPRWRVSVARKDAVAAGRCAAPVLATPSPQSPPIEILTASVPQAGSSGPATDTVRYVLFRRSEVWGPGVSKDQLDILRVRSTPNVLTLVRRPAGWRIVPAAEFGGLGSGTAFVHVDCAIGTGQARPTR
jgi:hypothetical protein